MNMPVKSKLTLKGNVPEKLEAKGLDVSKLYNYTIGLTEKDVDIKKQVEAIASAVVSAITSQKTAKGTGYDIVLDAANGKGFVKAYAKRLASDIMETALGTASQSRAYKDALIANNPALDATDFVSDGKGGKKAAEADDIFASM